MYEGRPSSSRPLFTVVPTFIQHDWLDQVLTMPVTVFRNEATFKIFPLGKEKHHLWILLWFLSVKLVPFFGAMNTVNPRQKNKNTNVLVQERFFL